ncbi:MAG: FAD/NAD(P)-binding protein [Phycisphaerales bacterium]
MIPSTTTTAASAPAALAWTEAAPSETDIAIVGGGFSGLIALVHLLRLLPQARFVLFERLPRRAPGVAYGGCDADHLLNVPAGRMGAFPEDPGAFHRWLQERHPGRWSADDFVPRALFGEFVNELVAKELAAAGGRASLARDAVVHVERLPSGAELLLASGRTCVARALLLAPGLPPARAPWSRVDHGVARRALATDPWDAGAYEGIGAADPVIIVGSGLTAIDIVMTLRRRGHRGTITMVSRNGRLPHPHSPPGDAPLQLPASAFAGGPARALSALRRAARERMRAGLSWQGAVDAIRPHVTEVWRSWTPAQRQRFLRLARPFWEVHRHRVPVEVLGEMQALRAAGSLELLQGEVASLRPADGGVEVALRLRDGRTPTRRAVRLFNCVGPTAAVSESVDPLIGSLLRGGLACADASGLGLHADPEGRLRSAAGGSDERIFLVGALRRGELFESTAVPELRVQAATAARALAATLARDAAGKGTR